MTVSLGELRELLNYNEETGAFYWKKGNKKGLNAGCMHHTGYIYIRIDGVDYGAHYLAWYYIYGEIALIDHEDRRQWNNSLINLRKATSSQNAFNKQTYSNNVLGVKGIRIKHGKYEARIQVNKKPIYLGTFETLEEAMQVRQQAAKHYFGEFANG